jgi:MATE family multidrug resistance protein
MKRFHIEGRALLSLGLPMIATQLFIMGTGFLDTAMAGHYSATDLAGVAMGGNVLWPVFMLMTGLNMALTPIVAQLRGAERVTEIGAVIRQGVWIALFTSALAIFIVVNAEPAYRLAGVDEGVIRVAMGYLQATAWGLPPVMVYVALRHTAEGLGHTKPPMVIAGAILPINGLLNYALIYGKFGLPELGGVGCGWATAAVFWLEPIMMLIVLRRPYFLATRLWDKLDPPNPLEIWRILRIGLPVGVTVFLEMAVYSAIGFMIGRIGVTELAAHSIAGNLNWLTYVIPMSLGSAASIRVGYYVGANDYTQARYSAATAFRISLVYALAVSGLLVAFRSTLVSVYSNDPAVLEIAMNLLLFIAVYQIVDDTQATTVGALRGYKDTRVPMLISLIGFWVIALPLGTVLAFGGFSGLGQPAMGVYGYWTGMTIGLFIVAIAVGVRLWRTSHDDSRVKALAAR